MVVTGLHLLGGARADATRVRSGADRAVVEGRFTTTELGDGVAVRVDEILESSGADRDDDGSVIAARSVSRDGPSRAYLGGRSVPAKSLSTFTTELLALHGQNDQLRLMRPDEQRAALDRFVDVESQLKRYRRVRDDWLDGPPRSRRPHAAGTRAGAGSRPAEVRTQRNRHRRTATRRGRRARRRHPPAVRTRRAARGRADGTRGAVRRSTTTRAGCGVGRQRRRAREVGVGGDRRLGACGRWPSSSPSALAVITDVSTELGDYLAELPSDASTLETKLARQGELRTLTRKYAADIDGVLRVGARVARAAGAARRLRGGARRTRAPRRASSRPRSSAPQPNSPRRGPRPPRVWPRR